MIRKQSLVPMAVSICVLALLSSGCGKKKGGKPPMFAPAVQSAEAFQTNAPVLIDAFGATEDGFGVDIVPQVSGTLMQSLIKEGDIVTNGQPLFIIDPSDYEARVRQMEGVVKADQANVDLSRSTLEKNKALFEKKLISTEMFEGLEARVKAAEGQAEMNAALLDQAQLNLARCTVRSPLMGITSKLYLDPGNLAVAGATRLTNVRSYDPMHLEFSVSERYLDALRHAAGAGAVRLELKPRGTTNVFEGVLTFIDNAVNPLSGTILLRGQAPNPEMKLWARQFVDISIYAGVAENAVLIPEGAVQYGKMGSYVYAIKDGKADLRPVALGVRYHNLVQIMSGVAPGERVVALGQLMLFPGAPVTDLSTMPPQQQGGPGQGGPAQETQETSGTKPAQHEKPEVGGKPAPQAEQAEAPAVETK